MRYAQILAAAALALMSFAGTASATAFTSGGQIWTGKFRADAEFGHIVLHTTSGLTVECRSTIETNIEGHSSSTTAKGKVTGFFLHECTNGYSIEFFNYGNLEVHTQSSTNNSNGTITLTGTIFTVITPLGFSCEFSTNATDMGTLTGSSNTGTNATIDFDGVIPRTGGSFFCGLSGLLTGSYKIMTPNNINIH